jgi:SAM-dependent methyltransferase
MFITHCRICDSTDLSSAIDLGLQPWCNHFLKHEEIGTEPFYPLHVVYCHGCGLVQLDYTVPKEVMFRQHTYLSGTTRSLNLHFQAVAEEVDRSFFQSVPGKSALDIGSNDGTQLKHFKQLGYDVLGIEPCRPIAQMARDAGIDTLDEFFNLAVARQLGRKFHVINAAGVFFHLEELHSAAEGVREALRSDGVFVVQFLYMKRIVENLAFDQIYHEHLLYYTLHTLEKLLGVHGLAAFDAYLAPIHGGSIICFAAHQGVRHISRRLQALHLAEEEARINELSTYREFARRIEGLKTRDLAYLEQAKLSGKHVFGFGAPAKGNTLLNHFGIGTQYLDCLVEKNELRKGLYSPGMHIPIVLEREIVKPPDIYYVLAWNFKQEILANNRHLVEQGVEFYFPIDPEFGGRDRG